MTFERFNDYVKSIVGSAFLTHLFVNWLIIGTLVGRPDLVEKPFPIALVLCLIGAGLGWWSVFRTDPIVFKHCPICGSRVAEKSIKEYRLRTHKRTSRR